MYNWYKIFKFMSPKREREREGERVSLSAHTIITTSTREIYREDDFLDFSKASMV
jgi:hypothetical protein